MVIHHEHLREAHVPAVVEVASARGWEADESITIGRHDKRAAAIVAVALLRRLTSVNPIHDQPRAQWRCSPTWPNMSNFVE
jgi:hypothetical protein